jgi:hypothetical protein
MTTEAIQLAYHAHNYVPAEEYRRGQRKKMYNPIRAAPVLVAAMEHLGPAEFPLEDVRQRAREAVAEPRAAAHIEGLDWDQLKAFLSTIALFLKAGPQPQRKETGMRQFENKDNKHLSSEELGQRAMDISRKLLKTRAENNINKLKRLSAHITAASDKWGALAVLARFYPLSGVPGPVVNDLVGQLEQLDLDKFQGLVAKSLLFYEAQCKGWRPE